MLAGAGSKLLIDEVGGRTGNGLGESGDPSDDRALHIGHNCLVLCHQAVQGQSRDILLHKDQVRLHLLYLGDNDLHIRFFLLDDTLDVHEALLFIHIPQRVCNQQDLGVLDVYRHPFMSHVLSEDHSIHIFALALVLPLQWEDLYELIDVNGVIQEP